MAIENTPAAAPSSGLSHHLSKQARSRGYSPVKAMLKFTKKEGVLSLSGGLPNSAFFAFHSLVAAVPSPLLLKSDAPQHVLNDAPAPQPNLDMPSLLARALQYSLADGLLEINDIANEIVSTIYRPAYHDWSVLPTTGNTDATYKTWLTLCNPGEGILVEEWTFSVMLTSIQPLGLRPVPVQWMRRACLSASLKNLLENWDSLAPKGMIRPHTIYLVPVGQNPTGTAMSLQRKREIYDLCSKYDIIIVEDDPYYFMQFDDYSASKPGVANVTSAEPKADTDWVKSLQPTFLSLDVDGRVVRLDSFSKTLAPGLRLGWVTCNKLFADRFYALSEVTTQAPSGFSQAAVCMLWSQWGLSGYLTWLEGLRRQYKVRRDAFIDALSGLFTITEDHSTFGKVLTCHEPSSARALFSFVAPRGGMFLWVRIHIAGHPRFAALLAENGKRKDEASGELMQQLWQTFLDKNIVVMGGTTFCTITYCGEDRFGFDPDTLTTDHFRLSYSNFEVTEMTEAGQKFGTVIREFFSQ